MLWFLCLLYVMTRLLRGHAEPIVTTRNYAHRNVQLIIFQTADVTGPQQRKDPPWVNFGRHYYVLAFWVVTYKAFNCILVSKKPQYLTPPKKVLKRILHVTLSSVVQCWPNILHCSNVGQGESTGCMQKCRTMLAQHVTSKNVGQRLPKTLHPAVLHKIGTTCNIQQCWTMLA